MGKTRKGYIIENCRNCKREVVKKIKRCPYCGIMNPTVNLKDIFLRHCFLFYLLQEFSPTFNKSSVFLINKRV